MSGPQLSRLEWKNLRTECWYYQCFETKSLLHSVLNGFYMPYRLGDPFRIVQEIDDHLRNYDIGDVAGAFGKIIYVFDSVTSDIIVYNRDLGSGCICIYRTSEKEYHLVGTTRGNSVRTCFGLDDPLIQEIESKRRLPL